MSSMRGESGQRDPELRSDCWIGCEIRESGGITLDLQSKVASLYGESLRAQLRAGMQALGVEHAALGVEDGGALPFVVDARLETAVCRALPELRAAILPERRVTPAASARERFRRSRLYLPGNSPKFMINAGLHGPDAVILDLEDAVAPGEKDAARRVVRNALRCVDFGPAERMVRINQGEMGLADLDWVLPHGAQLILIPKVESAETVRAVADRVEALRREAGLEDGVWLMPIIESARGGLKALEIAEAAPTVVALAIGLEDYTADLGVPRTQRGEESRWLRGQIVNAARAAGVQAIDTVYSDVADREGLRTSVLEAKALGFDGKGCIHPRQIAVVHAAFAPTPEEIAKACAVVRAFEAAEAKGLGVVSLGSKMIDPPVVKRALRTVAQARSVGLLGENWREEAEEEPR